MANRHRNSHKRSNTRNQNSMKPLIWITIGFVGIIILLVVLTTLQGNNRQRFTELPSLEGQQVIGDASAPVTVIEFGDYLCPSCMQWDKLVYPQLHDEYIESGKVQYAFINTLFHGAQSQLASLASESVFKQAPEHFWTFHEAVFDAQAEHGHEEHWVMPNLLLSLAEEHVPGIDLDKLADDLANQSDLPALVTDMDLVGKYEIKVTPTVMINGIVMNDPFDYDEIKETIEQELEASGK